jgi:hypothetical protein
MPPTTTRRTTTRSRSTGAPRISTRSIRTPKRPSSRSRNAYYAAERYPEAIAAYGNFERMHPTSRSCRPPSTTAASPIWRSTRRPNRDQQPIRDALTTFKNIVDRFPARLGRPSAAPHPRVPRGARAHEADVATYYLQQESIRAASRLRGLLVDYPETDAAADALLMLGRPTTCARTAGGEARVCDAGPPPPGRPRREGARERLGGDTVVRRDPLPSDDRLPRQRADPARRANVPRTVSAYPGHGQLRAGQRY